MYANNICSGEERKGLNSGGDSISEIILRTKDIMFVTLMRVVVLHWMSAIFENKPVV